MEVHDLEARAPQCRICHEGEERDRPLFYPCKCIGSIKFIHEDCLAMWFRTVGRDRCEVCKELYTFSPKYTADHSKIHSWAELVSKTAIQTAHTLSSHVLVKFYWMFIFPTFLAWWCKGFWHLSSITPWTSPADGWVLEFVRLWLIGEYIHMILPIIFEQMQDMELRLLKVLAAAEQFNRRRHSRTTVVREIVGQTEQSKPLIDCCWQYTSRYTESWSAGLKFHVNWLVGMALFIVLPMMCAHLLLYICSACDEQFQATAMLIVEEFREHPSMLIFYLAWCFGHVRELPGKKLKVDDFLKTLCALQRLILGQVVLCTLVLVLFACKYIWLLGPWSKKGGRRLTQHAANPLVFTGKVMLVLLPMVAVPAALFVVAVVKMASILFDWSQLSVNPWAVVAVGVVLAVLLLLSAAATTTLVLHVVDVIHATVPKKYLPRVAVSDIYSLYRSSAYSISRLATMCLSHLAVQLAVFAACVVVPFYWGHVLCPLLPCPLTFNVDLQDGYMLTVEYFTFILPGSYIQFMWPTTLHYCTNEMKLMAVKGYRQIARRLAAPSRNRHWHGSAFRSLLAVRAAMVVTAFTAAAMIVSWVLRAPLAVGRAVAKLLPPPYAANDMFNLILGFLLCWAGGAVVKYVCEGSNAPHQVVSRFKDAAVMVAVGCTLVTSCVALFLALEDAYLAGPLKMFNFVSESCAPGSLGILPALVWATVRYRGQVQDIQAFVTWLAAQLLVARQHPREVLTTELGRLIPVFLRGLLIPFVLSFLVATIGDREFGLSPQLYTVLRYYTYLAYLAVLLAWYGLQRFGDELLKSLRQAGVVKLTLRLRNRVD